MEEFQAFRIGRIELAEIAEDFAQVVLLLEFIDFRRNLRVFLLKLLKGPLVYCNAFQKKPIDNDSQAAKSSPTGKAMSTQGQEKFLLSEGEWPSTDIRGNLPWEVDKVKEGVKKVRIPKEELHAA